MSDSDFMPLRWGISGRGLDRQAPLERHQAARGRAQADGCRLPREEPKRMRSPTSTISPTATSATRPWSRIPEVDVVYVATPHTFHEEHATLALNHGKAGAARKAVHDQPRPKRRRVVNDRAFQGPLPDGRHVEPLLSRRWSRSASCSRTGAIGEVRQLQADFGFRAGVNPESRLFNPGARRRRADGCRCLHSLAGLDDLRRSPPRSSPRLANIGSTGVDEDTGLAFPLRCRADCAAFDVDPTEYAARGDYSRHGRTNPNPQRRGGARRRSP